MSTFDICKDKWFFFSNSMQERDAFLEWAYEQGMSWSAGVAPCLQGDDVYISGNFFTEGVLGWAMVKAREFYESYGHVEIHPEFKYKMCVAFVPSPEVESPQQKQIRELEETIARATQQINELKKDI